MIVNFGGGLGNQMFMYAFAKALQMEGCEVIIDGSNKDIMASQMGGGIA